VLDLYQEKLATIDPKMIDKDPKSLLQEFLQGKKIAVPEYAVVQTSGEAHAQTFVVECFVQKFDIRTIGEGTSRRLAEQKAAQLAMQAVEQLNIRKPKK
jgi:ribonuclease-3